MIKKVVLYKMLSDIGKLGQTTYYIHCRSPRLSNFIKESGGSKNDLRLNAVFSVGENAVSLVCPSVSKSLKLLKCALIFQNFGAFGNYVNLVMGFWCMKKHKVLNFWHNSKLLWDYPTVSPRIIGPKWILLLLLLFHTVTNGLLFSVFMALPSRAPSRYARRAIT